MPPLQRLASALTVLALLVGVVACGDDDDAKPADPKTAFCADFMKPSPDDTPVETLQAIVKRAKTAAAKAPAETAAAIKVFVDLGEKAIAESDGKVVTKAAMGELGSAVAGLQEANQKVVDYCS